MYKTTFVRNEKILGKIILIRYFFCVIKTYLSIIFSPAMFFISQIILKRSSILFVFLEQKGQKERKYYDELLEFCYYLSKSKHCDDKMRVFTFNQYVDRNYDFLKTLSDEDLAEDYATIYCSFYIDDFYDKNFNNQILAIEDEKEWYTEWFRAKYEPHWFEGFQPEMC